MRRHDFDPLSFLFGLFFVGAGVVLLGGVPVEGGVSLAWTGPLVAIGLAALIIVAVRPRSGSGTDIATQDDEPAA